MDLALQELRSEATTSGFPPETLDKVIHQIGLLNASRNEVFV